MRFPLGRDPSPPRSRARAVGLVLSLAPILLGVCALAVCSPLDVSDRRTWPALGIAAAGWLGALWLARRTPDLPGLGVVLVAGAIALRVPFLASDPRLSDDAARYLWEGALTAHRTSPYLHAPAAPELAPWRERWPTLSAQVNHPEVPAAYPPLAQIVHAGVVSVAGEPEPPRLAEFLLRLLYASADLLVCWPLARILRARQLPLAGLVAWGWNPWVALEFAGQGHLDALAVLALIAGLACIPRTRGPERSSLALVLLGLGASIKLLPAVLAPFVARRTRRPLVALGAFLAVPAVCALPFVLWTGTWPRASGLSEYAFRWESFSLAYRWIEPLFARIHPYDEGWNDPRRLARGLVALVWTGVALLAWRRRLDPVRAGGLLCGAFLALTPTLHPWYLTWIVPFLAIRPSLAWSALVALAPLLYWPLAGWRARATWDEPAWLWPVMGGLFWGLALLGLVRSRGRSWS